jgi:hypothetical protein
MVRLTPKMVAPTVAIKLRDEVIAEIGDWLLIMPDDQVVVMNDADVRAVYTQIKETHAPAGKKSKYTRVVGVSPRSFAAIINGKPVRVGAQTIRTLSALNELPFARGTTSQVANRLTHPDDAQVSARMLDAIRFECVQLDKFNRPFIYQLTPAGAEVVHQFGKEAGRKEF